MSGTFRADLRTYLQSKAALTAYLTSPDGKKRIYQGRVPKSNPPLANFPAVVFRCQSGGHEHDLDGSAGYARPLYEFHVMGVDSVIVEAIGEELRLAIQGFRGAMGGTTVDQSVNEDEVDDVIETKVGDDVFLYRTTWLYRFGYAEAIPTFT